MGKVVFQVEFHRDDADRVYRLAAAHGIEPNDFITFAAYSYSLRLLLGKEPPPARTAVARTWCSICEHSYTPGSRCKCP